MKKFIFKSILIILLVLGPVALINYKVDPAHLFDRTIVENAAMELNKGNIIASPGDFDEGLLQELTIANLPETPKTVIVGSSHIMYIPWEYENYYVGGLSGAYCGDYFAICGILDANNITPERIVFGVDPWAFNSAYDSGRHSSVASYAKYEYDLVKGNETKAVSTGIQFNKLKEIFSFSYFQSSFKNLKSRGIKYYLDDSAKEITIVTNPDEANLPLIYPNGRRSMTEANYESFESINNTALSAIDNREIYQLGSQLTEINAQNYKDFEDLVLYLKNKGVKVEIYLASWYPLVYGFLENLSEYKGVIELEKMIRELGSREGITVHGSYDPEIGGVTEEDFADWLHLKPERMLDNYNVVVTE